MDRHGTNERTRASTTNRRNPNPGESGKWISALIGLLGLWMIVQVFWFDVAPAQFWNDIVVGVLLLAVGGYNYYRRSNEEVGSVAAASVAALLGLWLVVTPFVLGADVGLVETANDAAFWNDIVVGFLAFVLGAYSAYETREGRREAAARRTAT